MTCLFPNFVVYSNLTSYVTLDGSLGQSTRCSSVQTVLGREGSGAEGLEQRWKSSNQQGKNLEVQI